MTDAYSYNDTPSLKLQRGRAVSLPGADRSNRSSFTPAKPVGEFIVEGRSDLRTPAKLSSKLSSSLRDEFNVEVLNSGSLPTWLQRKIAQEQLQEGPFYLIDLGALVRRFEQWCHLLPRVEPFYAIKCNPEPALIKTLAELGAGFDCASLGEIMQVLSYGVAPERLIMANPCKPSSHIVGARKAGVARMTFDNADELQKIARVFPDAELVLRILADDSHSVMRFGSKFGAPPSSWAGLMELARSLGLNIIGISFHVGSGCMSPLAFTAAVHRARAAFDVAAEYGYRLQLLDIGGGFPGNDPDPDPLAVSEAAGAGPGSVDGHSQAPEFEAVARALGPELDALFPPEVRIIGEPGRFFAASTHTLAVSVCSRRVLSADAPREVPHSDDLRYLYYINDGVYGSFNCIFFDHAQPQPRVLSASSLSLQQQDPTQAAAPSAPALHRSKIFGPTCDSLDVVCAAAMLPELDVGDWLYFRNMGAYTTAAASRFNGFRNSTFFYVESTSCEHPPAPLKMD